MPDLGPNKKRIAQFFRMLGTSGGERRNAWDALVREMQKAGVNWTDIGDVIENGGEDNGKYTETEMCEAAQAARAEGVDEGIKLGMARASNGGNGQITLPGPSGMAQYCHDRLRQLKDDRQRDFVSDMYVVTQRRTNLSRGQLAYLASVYIQTGGKY
jgi:hypothetical protein